MVHVSMQQWSVWLEPRTSFYLYLIKWHSIPTGSRMIGSSFGRNSRPISVSVVSLPILVQVAWVQAQVLAFKMLSHMNTELTGGIPEYARIRVTCEAVIAKV